MYTWYDFKSFQKWSAGGGSILSVASLSKEHPFSPSNYLWSGCTQGMVLSSGSLAFRTVFKEETIQCLNIFDRLWYHCKHLNKEPTTGKTFFTKNFRQNCYHGYLQLLFWWSKELTNHLTIISSSQIYQQTIQSNFLCFSD